MIGFSVKDRRGAVSAAVLSVVAGFVATAGVAAAQGTATPADAAAAPASSIGVEEIVVTATRHKDTTANTALAIQAFSGAQLESAGVVKVQDLGKIDPAVTVLSFGATQSQVVIRGISSTIGATSGAYLDEAPLLSAYHTDIRGDGTPGLQYQDVERFEVLKGPQGTLFGAGSMAGTLRVITNKPNLETYSGKIDANFAGVDGGDALVSGSFVANVPVVQDIFAIRFVGYGEDGGGYIDQTAFGGRRLSNVNDEHGRGGRITALLKPIDPLTITASISYQDVDVDGPQWWDRGAGPYNNNEPSTNPSKDSYLNFNFDAQYDIDDVGTINAIYSHGQRRLQAPSDSSGQNCSLGYLCVPLVPPLSYVTSENYADWTSELRFSSQFDGPVQLVAGAYYQDESSTFEGDAIWDNAQDEAACYTVSQCEAEGLRKPGFSYTGEGSPSSPFRMSQNAIKNYVEYSTIDALTVRQYALYAQTDYKILDNLTLTGGIRFFAARVSDIAWDEQDIYTGPCNWFGGCVTPRNTVYQGYSDQYKTTYNMALLYKITPDISVYARAASGFRIGGLNPGYYSAIAFGDHTVPLDYKPDSLWDYEIGTKAYFFDHSLRVDLSYYHIDWSDEQVEALSAGAFPYTLNAGRTATDGVELNVTYRLTPELTIAPSVTYVNSVLAHQLPAPVAAAGFAGNVGDRLPFTPHWTGLVSLNYSAPLSNDIIGYATGNVSYRSGSANGFNASDNFYTKLTPYTMIDLRFGMSWDKYDLSLFIENLTNRSAEEGAYAAPDGYRIWSAQPRTIGVSAKASF